MFQIQFYSPSSQCSDSCEKLVVLVKSRDPARCPVFAVGQSMIPAEAERRSLQWQAVSRLPLLSHIWAVSFILCATKLWGRVVLKSSESQEARSDRGPSLSLPASPRPVHSEQLLFPWRRPQRGHRLFQNRRGRLRK